MATNYLFKAYYKVGGVGTALGTPPTCTVVNAATDVKLVNAAATTASNNMPGLYKYTYSGADGLDCVAYFHTADANADEADVASYTDLVTYNIRDYVDTEIPAIKSKTDNLPASPAAVGSAMTLASSSITAAVIATGAIDADALATDAVAEIADGVWDESITGHTTTDTFGKSNQVQPSVQGDAMTLTSAAVDLILDEVVVGTFTMRQLLKAMAAVLAGKVSGGGTTSLSFTGVDNTAGVVVATVDTNGNRTAVTLTV